MNIHRKILSILLYVLFFIYLFFYGYTILLIFKFHQEFASHLFRFFFLSFFFF